jgi:hypothetical protein
MMRKITIKELRDKYGDELEGMVIYVPARIREIEEDRIYTGAGINRYFYEDGYEVVVDDDETQ